MYDSDVQTTRKYKRNKPIGMIILGIVWAVVITGLVIINIFVKNTLVFLGLDGGNLKLMLNVVVFLLFIIATAYYIFAWDKISIYVTDDALVMQKAYSVRRYSLRSISSVEVRQQILGVKFNYGTIIIHFQDKESRLEISLIEDPNNLSKEIKISSTESKRNIRILPS